MYSGVVEMNHAVHELRKSMASLAAALGQLGHVAMTRASDPELAVRILKRLQGVASYEDVAGIFPTHLSGGIIRAHAERGICAMLCPSDGAVPAERETGKAGGIVVVAERRFREGGAGNEAQRLVLAELDERGALPDGRDTVQAGIVARERE